MASGESGGPLRSLASRNAVPQGTRYLGFRAGEGYYAVPLLGVREILKLSPVTEVPRAGAHVLGVISAHGAVVTLMDLRNLLGAARSPSTPQARVLLVRRGEEELALFVDALTQVYRLTDAQVEPASALAGAYGPHVTGVARPWSGAPQGAPRRPDELLVLVDLGVLLDGR